MNYEEIPGLTEEDVKKLGADLSMVAVCDKIRKLGKLSRIKLDETVHRSGLNKHLFNYLEYCGMDVLDFVKEYLSNLQPYMIERRQDQEKMDNYICVIDNLYRVSVYIKVDARQFEEIIISFHEDNIRGVAKTNSLDKIEKEASLIPVFIERYGSVNKENGVLSFDTLVQRGVKIMPLSITGAKIDYGKYDIALVARRDVENQFIGYCNQYIRDLYASNMQLPEFDEIEIFSMLQQISFTSYGRDTFSSVSLLIDSSTSQHTAAGKQTADFALVTFVKNLAISNNQKDDLMALLKEKYMVTSIKGIDEILFRIQGAMYGEDKFRSLQTIIKP